jgi:hypothetical protein
MSTPRTLLYGAALFGAASCFGQQHSPATADSTRGPKIRLEPEFLSDTIPFDSLEATHHYYLRILNIGDEPLVISNIQSGDPCFCSSWPREPILPGASGDLRVSCPGMGPGTRKQTYVIQSNEPEPRFFRVERVGLQQP